MLPIWRVIHSSVSSLPFAWNLAVTSLNSVPSPITQLPCLAKIYLAKTSVLCYATDVIHLIGNYEQYVVSNLLHILCLICRPFSFYNLFVTHLVCFPFGMFLICTPIYWHQQVAYRLLDLGVDSHFHLGCFNFCKPYTSMLGQTKIYFIYTYIFYKSFLNTSHCFPKE